MSDKSQGDSTGCTHKGGSGGFSSLNKCKAHAKASNANALNWRNGLCYYKRCADLNLQLTKRHGGFDVYSLQCGQGENMKTF